MRRIRLAVYSAQISRIGTFGLVIAAVLVTCFAADLPAQLPQTRLSSVFPPGGQAGTTLELKLTSGTDLDEVDRLYFNHAGLKAVPKMQESGGKKSPVTNTFLVSIDKNVPPGLYEVRATGLFGMSNPRTFVVGDREGTSLLTAASVSTVREGMYDCAEPTPTLVLYGLSQYSGEAEVAGLQSRWRIRRPTLP